ncbi:hypothetical protein C0Q70_11237 [Pomacea canaliculata]|uniref:Uncharacterized protein n=1 Tax=Pomacea canaliculata TaxID=400727 RepID=A0A2T7P5H1_POMCA|nr:hypothetical protein C0Q70_11237 [Pomacea canaliculata]
MPTCVICTCGARSKRQRGFVHHRGAIANPHGVAVVDSNPPVTSLACCKHHQLTGLQKLQCCTPPLLLLPSTSVGTRCACRSPILAIDCCYFRLAQSRRHVLVMKLTRTPADSPGRE